MNAEEHHAYLRAIEAVQTLSSSTQSQSGREEAARAVVCGPPAEDVFLWCCYALQSMLHGKNTKGRDGAPCEVALTWTRVMCCWLEACTEWDVATRRRCGHVILPVCRLMFSSSPVLYSRIEGVIETRWQEDVGHEATEPMKGSDRGRETLPYVLARCKATMSRDVLQVTWDLVNPKSMQLIAMKRLEALGPALDSHLSATGTSFAVADVATTAGDGIGSCTKASVMAALEAADQNPDRTTAIHAACMEPLLHHLREQHSSEKGPLAEHGQAEVSHFLERVAYDIVTKLSSGIVEQGYYALPFLADFLECGSFVKEERYRKDLARLKAAVQAATSIALSRQITGALAGYAKTATQSKTWVSIPNSQVRLSRCAFNVLSAVVEPCMNILRRPREETCVSGEDLNEDAKKLLSSLVREAFATLETPNVGPQKGSSKTLSRTREDALVLLTYIAN